MEARLAVVIDGSGAKKGADQVERELNRIEKEGISTAETFKKHFSRLGPLIGSALAGFSAANALREFSRYEQGLTNVGAVAGATAVQLDQLGKAALDAASRTAFNPEQTTGALYSLASAGLSVQQQLSSLNPVLDYAQAAQADLGQATESVVSTMNTFGIAANDTNRIVDVFTASIGASATNSERIALAMRNAAPTAAALGQSFEGTMASLNLLTTAFGNGERAGTGLRSALVEIGDKASTLGVNVKDAQGQMLPMVEIIRRFEEAGIDATKAINSFGAEAGPALAVLLKQGSDAIATMEKRIQSSGQAGEIAAKQMDTLNGAVLQLESASDVLKIRFAEQGAGAAKDAVEALTAGVNALSENIGEVTDIAAGAAAVFAAVMAGRGINRATTATTELITRQREAAVAMGATTRAAQLQAVALNGARGAASGLAGALGGPTGIALAGFTAAVSYAYYEIEKMNRATARLQGIIDGGKTAISEMEAKVSSLSQMAQNAKFMPAEEITRQMKTVQAEIESITSETERLNRLLSKPDLLQEGQFETFGLQVSKSEAAVTKLQGTLIDLAKAREKAKESAQRNDAVIALQAEQTAIQSVIAALGEEVANRSLYEAVLQAENEARKNGRTLDKAEIEAIRDRIAARNALLKGIAKEQSDAEAAKDAILKFNDDIKKSELGATEYAKQQLKRRYEAFKAAYGDTATAAQWYYSELDKLMGISTDNQAKLVDDAANDNVDSIQLIIDAAKRAGVALEDEIGGGARNAADEVENALKKATASFSFSAGRELNHGYKVGGIDWLTGEVTSVINHLGERRYSQREIDRATMGTSYARAGGGKVYPGQAYDVGERGRERFIPDVPGKIVPNHELGGGSTTINITINGTNKDPKQIAEEVAAVLNKKASLGKATISTNAMRSPTRRTG
jgi:TP901 family phage tail tape measure protein